MVNFITQSFATEILGTYSVILKFLHYLTFLTVDDFIDDYFTAIFLVGLPHHTLRYFEKKNTHILPDLLKSPSFGHFLRISQPVLLGSGQKVDAVPQSGPLQTFYINDFFDLTNV